MWGWKTFFWEFSPVLLEIKFRSPGLYDMFSQAEPFIQILSVQQHSTVTTHFYIPNLPWCGEGQLVTQLTEKCLFNIHKVQIGKAQWVGDQELLTAQAIWELVPRQQNHRTDVAGTWQHTPALLPVWRPSQDNHKTEPNLGLERGHTQHWKVLAGWCCPRTCSVPSTQSGGP